MFKQIASFFSKKNTKVEEKEQVKSVKLNNCISAILNEDGNYHFIVTDDVTPEMFVRFITSAMVYVDPRQVIEELERNHTNVKERLRVASLKQAEEIQEKLMDSISTSMKSNGQIDNGAMGNMSAY